MRVSNDQYFTPQIVSIGPIHYQNEKLRVNGHLKERYLAEFCELTKVLLEECYQLLLDKERRLRNCYADVFELNSENFVKMVLVDAAFLLMTLLYQSCRNLISSTDQLFVKQAMIIYISRDMLLLENQLPFFVLEDLCKLSKLQNILERNFVLNFSEETAITHLAISFVSQLTRTLGSQTCSNSVHLLDLFRNYLIPADWTPERKKAKTTIIPSMKELHQAGVKIQVGSKENMFDIIFHDGILEIPPLFIHGPTELYFRNLLAFELSHCMEKHIFSDYFQMMRLLTLSSVDTELLIQYGVIENGLPYNERVTTLFHNITTGNLNTWNESPYSDVVKDLNEYYKT